LWRSCDSFTDLFEKLDGLTAIENLQYVPNETIYKSAQSLLEKHFKIEERYETTEVISGYSK